MIVNFCLYCLAYDYYQEDNALPNFQYSESGVPENMRKYLTLNASKKTLAPYIVKLSIGAHHVSISFDHVSEFK